MSRLSSLALLLFVVWPCAAQDPPPKPVGPAVVNLSVPPTASTPVNFPIPIRPTVNDGGTVRWLILDAGLQEYDLKKLFDPIQAKAYSEGSLAGRMYWSATPGRYRVAAVSAKGDAVSPFAICVIVVGDAPAPPTPTPTPTPGPTPPVPPPTPASESPFKADGLRCLIVFHREDLAKYPASQIAAMQSKEVQSYMSANCVKGSDGTPEWRMWNDDANVDVEPQLWKDAFRLPRDKMPWLYVGNGKAGYSGPLPATAKGITDLMGKFTQTRVSP